MSFDSPLVRPASSDDWRVWRELRLEALSAAPYAFASRLEDWQGDGDHEERWRARLSIPGSCNLLAEANGRPIGMVSGFPGPGDGVVELGTLWIKPMARGQGVGDRLVQAVEQWAVRGCATVLRLTVSPENEHAIALYRRNGFDDAARPGDPRAAGWGPNSMAKWL
ncbi:GNAT family N-acetyltransferase [Nocardia noduli]|uniref:GNAT family N-acetyltransferase n=1 Tax=Nocardia noduli TaxID=2815722 RepID=UPI0020B23B40|nr:GNAT family N-acetyltransferase [Nocardia noduli]